MLVIGAERCPGGCGWAEFNLDWWAARAQPNVLLLFYEDARANLTRTVESVTRFLGRAVEPETLERVRHLASFEHMKARAKSFEPPGCFNPLSLPVARPHDVNMINEGKVDRGRHELSAELRQEVSAYVRRVLNGTELLDRYEQYL